MDFDRVQTHFIFPHNNKINLNEQSHFQVDGMIVPTLLSTIE
jgi:hypothetical protein